MRIENVGWICDHSFENCVDSSSQTMDHVFDLLKKDREREQEEELNDKPKEEEQDNEND